MTRLLQFLRAGALAFSVTFSLHGFAQVNVLSVSATVAPTCIIVGGTLNFLVYSGLQNDAQTTITAQCTNGASAYIVMNDGTNPGAGSSPSTPKRQMTGPASAVLAYDLYTNSPRTTVWGGDQGSGQAVTGSGLAQTLTVYGRIPGGQYSATPGAYVDTVQISFVF